MDRKIIELIGIGRLERKILRVVYLQGYLVDVYGSGFLFRLLILEWNNLHTILTINTMLHLLKLIPLTQDITQYHMKQDTEISE